MKHLLSLPMVNAAFFFILVRMAFFIVSGQNDVIFIFTSCKNGFSHCICSKLKAVHIYSSIIRKNSEIHRSFLQTYFKFNSEGTSRELAGFITEGQILITEGDTVLITFDKQTLIYIFSYISRRIYGG